MSQTSDTLQPGKIAQVRQRTYLVEQIVKPKRVADSTLVKLSCVDDDNQGAPLEVLWEKQLDPQVLTSEAWESIAAKGVDESKLFAAYLNTLKWNCVTSTDPKLSRLLYEYRNTVKRQWEKLFEMPSRNSLSTSRESKPLLNAGSLETISQPTGASPGSPLRTPARFSFNANP